MVSMTALRSLAAAAPESTEWAMLILGVGMIGGALRSRRTAIRVA